MKDSFEFYVDMASSNPYEFDKEYIQEELEGYIEQMKGCLQSASNYLEEVEQAKSKGYVGVSARKIKLRIVVEDHGEVK